jgi:hypothetical protein
VLGGERFWGHQALREKIDRPLKADSLSLVPKQEFGPGRPIWLACPTLSYLWKRVALCFCLPPQRRACVGTFMYICMRLCFRRANGFALGATAQSMYGTSSWLFGEIVSCVRGGPTLGYTQTYCPLNATPHPQSNRTTSRFTYVIVGCGGVRVEANYPPSKFPQCYYARRG